MSVLTMKYVSQADPYANGAIKVSPDAYNPLGGIPKSGLIEVKITSVVLTYSGSPVLTPGHGAVIMDIRAASFNEDCDTPILNNATINQDTTTTTFANDDGTYYFSVNNGMIGPAAEIDADGYWNLLNILLQIFPDVLIPFQMVINYTVTYYDQTPTNIATPGA